MAIKPEKKYTEKTGICGACPAEVKFYILEGESPPRNDPVCVACRKSGIMAVVSHSKLKKGK